MAAGKKLPLQQGNPVCFACAAELPPPSPSPSPSPIKMKRKKEARELEMCDGYDVTDPFVNDGSID